MPAHPVTKVLRLREDCGKDERWLRAEIEAAPSILGLGDLVPVATEKTQTDGGRLDLLLRDTASDAMYEVELQLGKTDPSHIIRTIEYWDGEKRRRPRRSHTAVLVAEEITTRFFNVVRLLSEAIPIIGIQVNMVQVGEARALHFTTIINTFVEEEVEEGPPVDEKYWRDNHPAALQCAQWYKELLARSCRDVGLRLRKTMITLPVDGPVRAAVWPRANGARLSIEKLSDVDLAAAEEQLNRDRIVFTRKANSLVFDGNLEQLKETQAAHEWVALRIAKET